MKRTLKKYRLLFTGALLVGMLILLYAAILAPAGKSSGSFSDFCTTLFHEEMMANTMNLHFTLKNPQAAGIDN